MEVPLSGVARQFDVIREPALQRFDELSQAGAFTLGEELAKFEREFADYCGTAECVGVGSGTSALELALAALGAGPGTEVVTVPYTFVATIEAIAATGATPVFVDVDPRTRTMDARSLSAKITERTVAVVVVHLYGRPADLPALAEVCERAGVALVEDAAQAHGASIGGRRVGAWGAAAAFSFYPTKNLGALGDGGAVVTDDREVAASVRSLRHHGSAPDDANRHERDGTSSRLDNLQAAFLRLKLPLLDSGNARRRALAERYREALADLPLVAPPGDAPDADQVFHLFVVEIDERDRVLAALRGAGVQAGVHYPLPVHLQPVWRRRGYAPGDFPASERLAERVLSLPIFPQLGSAELDHVVAALRAAIG
jgi:dTDP-4-amino-4,6-dideoxygalactose transaminase